MRQSGIPSHPIADGQYIGEWLVLGPLLPDDLGFDFLAHAGGEANIAPGEGDTVTTADGRTLTWECYRSKTKVATDKGVLRYDSEGFDSFTTEDRLPDKSVQAILRSSDGKIWFGTNSGISRYDPYTFASTTVRDELGIVTKGTSFPGIEFTATHQDRDGNLWFGTDTSVSCYDGDQIRNFIDKLADSKIIAIYQDRDGNLWLGKWGSGVSCYDGNQIANFTRRWIGGELYLCYPSKPGW